MNCPRCQTAHAEVAHFCAACGADVRATSADGQMRRQVFAAHPGEPLFSFNVVTSLMPLASATAPQTYKFALAIGLAIPVVAALAGLLPFAIAAAAAVVPIVYLLYLYDVNEWEDQPIPVVLGTVAVAGVLSLVWTWLWREELLPSVLTFAARDGKPATDLETLLIVGVLVPIVSAILIQVGPIVLAMRPKFDDLIDALTFGVAAGATFAAIETIVLNRHLIFSGQSRFNDIDPAVWISLVLTSGLLKPLIYGAAAGIALAGFSGLGAGYDGFKPGYFRGLAEAIGGMIAFHLGVFLAGTSVGGTAGVVLGMVWALVVAAALVLRLRILLHTALLEGALEYVQRGTVPPTASNDVGYCPECEMPLLHQASFCIACGCSVRAGSKITRRANSETTVVTSEEAPV